MPKPVRQDDRGANLVEMTFVTVLLLLLIAGSADMGRAMHTWIVIHNAAREGARWGSRIPYDCAGIVDRTIEEAQDSGVDLSGDNATITVIGCGDGAVSGGTLEVDVQYVFGTIMAGIAGLDSLTLRTKAEMIVLGRDTEP